MISETIIAIDPGLNQSGLALFKRGKLQFACLTPLVNGKNPIRAVPYIREELRKYAPRSDRIVIIEKPRVYQTGLQKGDQRDIVNLALAVGAIGQLLRPKWLDSLIFVEPHEWKGQVPKEIMQKRIDKTLTAEELSKIVWPSKSLRHNVYDAIGLGLWGISKAPKTRKIHNDT